MWVRYDEIEEKLFRVEVFPAEHPIALKERLKRPRYEFKQGDLIYDLCPECGVPLAVARFKWDIDNGTIIDPDTGRKMSILGPLSLDSIYDDLEAELGSEIPQSVIEASRRFAKRAWNTDYWNRDSLSFQQMLALRGLGNIVHFEGDRNYLDLVIQNPCLHLVVIGVIQALVEMAYRVDSSTCEWELTQDGDLSMTVRVNH
ncbi:MAG: hypothetical protein JW738_02965, partial [Actinobacteria bacterium]|nr:hypothetical protein [Actinomycetota bacterium]